MYPRMTRRHAARVALSVGLLCATAEAKSAHLLYDTSSGPVRFAASDVDAALRARGFAPEHGPHSAAASGAAASASAPFGTSGGLRITFMTPGEALRRTPATREQDQIAIRNVRPEGFVLLRAAPASAAELWVVGTDAAGQMYGGLELAEQIRLAGIEGVTPLARNPHMALRGVKFNIPLDVRTPSYSDMSDAGQAAIANVWDFGFWRSYIDQLARDRYNLVSLWSEHPFPSLVRVPEYPDVALNDVWRSRAAFDEDYPTTGTGFVTPALLARVEVVRKLSIDQKIEFFRRVMEYGKERNVAFYLLTWNIFTYGVGGKYGITDDIDNRTTIDYFRASVRALLRTYPLLAGIGLTAGENMGDASFEAKESWAFATYGQAVLDAARAEPARRFRFIHRQHQTRAADIAKTFAPLRATANIDFTFSFKYAQAHVLSSTRQNFHTGFVESLGDLKTLWTLRNDDALMFRWAAPDFVREFIANIPPEKTAGYYFGSDMWVWAREFLDKAPQAPRQLEVQKHWLHFLLWGRMGYDPTLDNERIVGLVQQRFAGVDAATLLAAWQHASLIYPLVTGFHWGEFDFQWYIEGCRSRPGPAQTASGFHDVNRFITLGVHPATDNISIPRYVASLADRQPLVGTSPLAVAAQIAAHADAALAGLETLPNAGRGSAELRGTLGDIRAMARLGQYYAGKIRGATELALFRSAGGDAHRQSAVEALTRAAQAWREYTAEASARYENPVWTNRVGIVDWAELTVEVDKDIAIARNASAAAR